MVKVKEIMKRHVISIEPNVTFSKIAKILTNNRIGSVVVMKKDQPMNLITTNDIVTAIAKGLDLEKLTAEKFLKITKKPFLTVSPNLSILAVSKKMIKTGRKRFPVVEGDKLKGIVSTKEILLVSPELIEILSENLKARVEGVPKPEGKIEGICESCDSYSDRLNHINGNWLCNECVK